MTTGWARSILHPTDFSAASGAAFAHALAIALAGGARLDILHVGGSGRKKEPEWHLFPHVRAALVRWGKLPKGSAPEDVEAALGIHVNKVNLPTGNPAKAIADYFEEHPAQVIVLASEGRTGVPRWLKPSVAEPLAREAGAVTLFVLEKGRGFVNQATGAVRLTHVLAPIDAHPDPQGAIDTACAMLASQGAGDAKVEALHIGPDPGPELRAPTGHKGAFEAQSRTGTPAHEIIKAAKDSRTDLIVMATAGHDGLMDMLRGSTTEQVLRRAPCPVLAVPTMAA